jgi:hypothetical protein
VATHTLKPEHVRAADVDDDGGGVGGGGVGGGGVGGGGVGGGGEVGGVGVGGGGVGGGGVGGGGGVPIPMPRRSRCAESGCMWAESGCIARSASATKHTRAERESLIMVLAEVDELVCRRDAKPRFVGLGSVLVRVAVVPRGRWYARDVSAPRCACDGHSSVFFCSH